MKNLVAILLLLVFSCGKEKVIQLPEIKNAKIVDIQDVSAAYIFYDETQQDSVELNRKNLIISTNWLLNVDKRLTLKQALPSILKLQNKKRNATMHKNEAAKNYFTCNDTAIKNLGFIDFTNIVYQNELDINTFLSQNSELSPREIRFDSDRITIENNEFNTLNKALKQFETTKTELVLSFNSALNFQEYITYKAKLNNINSDYFTINTNEFIY